MHESVQLNGKLAMVAKAKVSCERCLATEKLAMKQLEATALKNGLTKKCSVFIKRCAIADESDDASTSGAESFDLEYSSDSTVIINSLATSWDYNANDEMELNLAAAKSEESIVVESEPVS